MADEIKATPRNALLGLLADALTSADAYASKKDYQGGLLNPPLNVLSGLLGVGGAGRTLDRLSYGEPITNMGKGSYKPLIPQDTADAAGLLAMVAPAASRGALNASDAAVRAITGNKAANSMNVLAEAARMRPTNPITVWHGSPSHFEGPPSKQYGGSYFSEKPAISADYAGPDGMVSKFDVDEKKIRVFDATNDKSKRVLRRIEREYDNATNYTDPADGEYMPLDKWVSSGRLFDLGRKAQNEVMESLRAEGYDAVRFLDNNMMHDNNISWVLFDPSHAKQIK